MKTFFKNISGNSLRISAAIFCATILIASCSVSNSSDPDDLYDERPEKGPAPLQTQFACDSDYTIENFLSYDAYRNVYAVDKPEGITLQHDDSYWKLYRCKDATYLSVYGFCAGDAWFFCFHSKTALIDSKTGDEYRLREVEHYPTDTCFWVNGAAGKWFRAVLVFPPLPPTVKSIDIFHPAMPSRDNFNGRADRYTNISVEELRGKQPSGGRLERGSYKKVEGGETIY